MVKTGPKISSHMVTDFGSLVTITVGSIKYPFVLLKLPPAIILTFLFFLALVMYLVMLVYDFSSITAFTKLVKSSTVPIFMVLMAATNFFKISSAKLLGI